MDSWFGRVAALAGVALVAGALAVLLYVLIAEQSLSGTGWFVIVVVGVAGAALVRGAVTRGRPLHCPQCGEIVERGTIACPRCGYSVERSMWAALGELRWP